MFAALDSLVESLVLLIPTVSRRPLAVEKAVVDTDGLFTKPRVYYTDRPVFHVPAWTSVEYYDTTPIILPLGKQTLTTADNQEVTIRCSVWVEILEPLLLRSVLGPDDWISSLSLEATRAISEFIRGENYLYACSIATDTLTEHVSEAVSIASNGTVEMVSLSIEDMVKTRSHRHFGVVREENETD